MRILIACLSLLLLVPSTTIAAEPVFRAGAVAHDVTPTKLPISSNGNMTDKMADSVHDPLHARTLVLDDGTTRLAIVVVDSCMIPRELIDQAKATAAQVTKIPADHILVSATHCHSAPTVTGVFQSDPDAEYQQFLAEQIAKAIQRAEARLAPAKIGWGVGSDPTQVFNRRWKLKEGAMPPGPFAETTDLVKMNPGIMNANLIEPAGPVDPEVSFVSVQTADGKPLALLANYSLHYVGGVPPLSADYFGEYAAQMKKLLGAGDDFVGIMSNGTSGDVNNVNFRGPAPPRQAPFERITIVAKSVADATYAAYQKVEHKPHVKLAMAEREIELGVRLPSKADIAWAKEVLAAAGDRPLKPLKEVYARETVLLAKYPATVKARLQAIRIGDLGIVSSPCETFTEIGLAIKRQSALKPTFTIELANGYNGYLPTPEQHKLGGYETWRARSSYLEVDASTKIQQTLLELLAEVAK